MPEKSNKYSILLKFTRNLFYFISIYIAFSIEIESCAAAKNLQWWHPNLEVLDHAALLYREPWDVIEDVSGCGIYSENDIDSCFDVIQRHAANNLNRASAETLGIALKQASRIALAEPLIASERQSKAAYFQLRIRNCDRLSHSAGGNVWHTMRDVWACRFWMDLHRRSLLQEAVGMAPMPVKSGRNRPHGPYRLVDIWRIVGTGEDRLARLRHQEQLSLARLASAKRRVRRVLDDWDETQDLVDIAERDFRQSKPAFERYRHAQCDDYTQKLAAAFGPTPTPEEAATACRILVNIEEATLLRYDFEDQPLMSQDRKPGESRNRW